MDTELTIDEHPRIIGGIYQGGHMQIQIYQRADKRKVPFAPLDKNHVRLYVCGPTVYSTPHIGNARPAVVFDGFVRLLRALYPEVTYVRNITDVDDKINAKAADEGVAIDVITKRYTKCYHEDLAALGCLAPDVEPKATEHMPEMIAMISALIKRGHAYQSQGHVCFSVPSYKDYGVVSGRDQSARKAGARVAVEAYKQHEEDFVLWKPSHDKDPGWDSPWGRGRPGWHIECSAMIEKHLGLPIDIHGGGGDLLFPHHENENAQGCCFREQREYVKYWMHNGMVNIDDEKMSKSLGNILLVRDLLHEAPGEVVRLALLQTHYRQPLRWHDKTLEQAKQSLDKAYRVLDMVSSTEVSDCSWSDIPKPIIEALCDDYNTPLALTHWQALYRKIQQQSTIQPDDVKALRATHQMLGLGQQDPETWFKTTRQSSLTAETINQLIEERNQARAKRDFQTADRIRDQLHEQGVEIEDSGKETIWRYR